MKRLFLILSLSVSLVLFSSAQNNPQTESQKLAQQVYSLYQQGKVEEAIPIAEKIVEIEKISPTQDLQNLAMAMTNLARLEKEHYEILMAERSKRKLSEVEMNENVRKVVKYAASISLLLRNSIEIYEKKLKTETPQLALVELELASFLTRNNTTFPRFKPDEAPEKLYVQALSLREKLLGENDDLTISTVLVVANFYQINAEMEKAAPLYQKFVRVVEKKYGEKSKILLPALREYATILVTTKREKEAAEIIKKISGITEQLENLPEADFDLTPRITKDKISEIMENPNTITSYLKKMKGFPVTVLIDEKGNIIEAKAADIQEKDIHGKNVREKAEREIRGWKFKPFFYEGTLRQMRGIVLYPYFIKA